jgi:hypothetical protein
VPPIKARSLAVATTIGCILSYGADGAAASKLSEVVEEAKKPVKEQEAVDRPAVEVGDDGSGVWAWVSLLLDIASTSSECGESEAAAAAGYDEIDGATRGGADPARRGVGTWNLSFKSLHMRTPDDVLAELGGAGIEVGLSASKARFEAGVYWLLGEFREDSPVHGGLSNPYEIAIDGRLRTRSTRILGLNGFVGLRYGRLAWDYANPVFAIDDYGYGDEIWSDSLNGISMYFGIGLRPFRTGALEVGVDLGAGWRTYEAETYEGFRNDVFRDSWFPQIGVEVALHF